MKKTFIVLLYYIGASIIYALKLLKFSFHNPHGFHKHVGFGISGTEPWVLLLELIFLSKLCYYTKITFAVVVHG
jgi:hypothetical protein